jgi:NAD(P)-dependent dehydrogenase (short-subunit alcohol dehydrogenase family)
MRPSSPPSLGGKTALVTGAGRGIGRAIAVGLAASGVEVGVVARTEDELEQTVFEVESIDGVASAFVRDLSDLTQAASLVREVEEQVGPLDILINNAGVVAPLGPTELLHHSEIELATRLNYIAPVIVSANVLPGMRDRGWGRIVDVSSGIVADPTRMVGGGTYAATKAALEAHALNLAAELKDSGVTVNVYRPGRVDTEMQAWIRRQDPERVGAGLVEGFQSAHASAQLITPEASATALIRRLSRDATGEIWNVDDVE